MSETKKLHLQKLNIPTFIQYALASWLAAITVEYLLLPKEVRPLTGLVGISLMSGTGIFLIAALVFVVLTVASSYFRIKDMDRWLLVGAFSIYATSAVINSFSWAFFGGCVLVMGILVIYAVYGWNGDTPQYLPNHKENKICPVVTAVAALAFFYLVSAWTVARIQSFCAPSFDFGIFSQMFHNMKTTGIPYTTVERDGLSSHFAVHVSPIYYLMLPFYCLVPRPETLQVLQVAVMASAVIPLWKLGKQHGLHPGLRTATCILLLLFPAFSGGAAYDLHENCFLTPLILWLLYGIDRKNIPLTAIAAILTLMVKEDAPVYVAIIALYLLLRSCLRKDKWGIATGSALMIVSLTWFFAVTAYLSNNGDGVMNYRYSNFMYDGSDSLLTVVKVVLLCPIKAVFECVDSEKLAYIGLIMLPLLGLPLFTRRYERYILLIPYLLVNLMSDYQYQHDIMFQYSFGSTACLFYLLVVNLSDFKLGWKKAASIGIALCITLGCFYETILPTAYQYISYCNEYEDYYDNQKSMLSTIPDDASVAATTFYTTYLSNRSQLYDIRYGSREHILSCEYIVIKVSESGTFKNYEVDGEKGKENFVAMLLKNGYHLENKLDGVMEIYRKIDG